MLKPAIGLALWGFAMLTGQRLWTGIACALRDWHCDWAHRRLRSKLARAAEARTGSAIVFAPHHDDETFGCGGMIALKRRRGIPVDVVFLSDGRRSHAHDAGVDTEVLWSRRKTEARAATAALNVPAERLHFLDLPDGRLGELTAAERSAAVAHIAALLRACEPQEIYVPHRRDRHADHEATFALVMDARRAAGSPAEVLQYAVWLIWRGPPLRGAAWAELGPAEYLPIDDALEMKRQAMAAYQSQLPILPRGFLRQFTRSYELYFPLREVADADRVMARSPL
jgi:N-acetylglucosamine malate deacetylase 1